MRTALVTGGSGAIGPALVHRLADDGWSVRVLVRKPPPPRLLPDSAQVILGDIADVDAIRAGVAGASHVFHLAARLHINSPGSALAGEYRRTNVDGSRLLAEAAAAAGVDRLVFFSTIAVYGATVPGELLNEDSPASAQSLYAVTKREAEDHVLAIRRGDGTPLATVLRLAGVYGSRIKGNYRQLVQWLRRGVFVPVGTGANRRTLVFDHDVADAAIAAALHPAAAGRVYNVTDGSVHTFREIVSVICDELQRRPPRVHVPIPVARSCARAFDAGLALGGRRSMAGPMVEKLIEDMAVDGSRLQHELGFKPRYDLRAGWRAAIPRIVREV